MSHIVDKVYIVRSRYGDIFDIFLKRKDAEVELEKVKKRLRKMPGYKPHILRWEVK